MLRQPLHSNLRRADSADSRRRDHRDGQVERGDDRGALGASADRSADGVQLPTANGAARGSLGDERQAEPASKTAGDQVSGSEGDGREGRNGQRQHCGNAVERLFACVKCTQR